MSKYDWSVETPKINKLMEEYPTLTQLEAKVIVLDLGEGYTRAKNAAIKKMGLQG